MDLHFNIDNTSAQEHHNFAVYIYEKYFNMVRKIKNKVYYKSIANYYTAGLFHLFISAMRLEFGQNIIDILWQKHLKELRITICNN